jgi:hypothetical protein
MWASSLKHLMISDIDRTIYLYSVMIAALVGASAI